MGLIRLLIYALAGLLIYVTYKKLVGVTRAGRADKEDERLGRLVQDPQCQVYVDSKDAVKRKVKGGELFFCSTKCAEEYLAEEQKEQTGA
jgi:YHS domain-containing protein